MSASKNGRDYNLVATHCLRGEAGRELPIFAHVPVSTLELALSLCRKEKDRHELITDPATSVEITVEQVASFQPKSMTHIPLRIHDQNQCHNPKATAMCSLEDP
eukprot:1159238-Pelagomonas_calceolata.AAC.4